MSQYHSAFQKEILCIKMYEYKNTPAKYDDFGPSNDWFNIIMFPKKDIY